MGQKFFPQSTKLFCCAWLDFFGRSFARQRGRCPSQRPGKKWTRPPDLVKIISRLYMPIDVYVYICGARENHFRLCRLVPDWDMKRVSTTCPRCRSGQTKRNGLRRQGGLQQYLCRECGRQWVEPRDPLVHHLRSEGIDARSQGILRAVGLFIRGLTMSRIEKITKIKGETLKRYLEKLRGLNLQGRGDLVEDLLKRKARLSSSQIGELHSFWLECEMTRNPYRTRGQDPVIKGHKT
jgi:transposase-like protein